MRPLIATTLSPGKLYRRPAPPAPAALTQPRASLPSRHPLPPDSQVSYHAARPLTPPHPDDTRRLYAGRARADGSLRALLEGYRGG